MKILNLVHGYFPALGGVEHLVRMLSSRLVKNYDDEVTVFTTNAYNTALFQDSSQKSIPIQNPEIMGGVKVIRYKVNNKFANPIKYAQELFYRFHLPGKDWLRALYMGPITPRMIGGIKESDADVILTASLPLLHMHFPFWAKTGKPIILMGCIHPDDKRNFDRKDVWKIIKRCDAYVALTEFEKGYLIDRGIEAEKIHVIGGGCEVDEFHDFKKVIDIRKKYGFKKNQKLIVFVGQQGGHKGVDTLISAMPLVWSQQPDAGLLIVGGETPFTPQFRQMAEQANSGRNGIGKIVIGGRISEEEKMDVLQQGDIFTSPSGHESFGISTIEAWSCEKPIIGCRIPATMSLVSEYEDGLLINYQDHEELSVALLELLEDPVLRKRLGKAGYKKARENYDWNVIAEKFRKVFKSLL